MNSCNVCLARDVPLFTFNCGNCGTIQLCSMHHFDRDDLMLDNDDDDDDFMFDEQEDVILSIRPEFKHFGYKDWYFEEGDLCVLCKMERELKWEIGLNNNMNNQVRRLQYFLSTGVKMGTTVFEFTYDFDPRKKEEIFSSFPQDKIFYYTGLRNKVYATLNNAQKKKISSMFFEKRSLAKNYLNSMRIQKARHDQKIKEMRYSIEVFKRRKPKMY